MAQSPLIDRRHLDFLLYEVLDVGALCAYPRYAMHERGTFEAVIELAHRLAVERFLPHNRKADLNEPRLVDGKVVLIPEIAAALAAYYQAGFGAMLAELEQGGMQLPFVIGSACDALFSAANPSTIAYPSLTRAAANLIAAHGSAAQKARYLPPLLEGRWFGTMCLSEPQAGSSLADLVTRAIPQSDGSYRIEGAKMWISAGEHELSENIVHLVLARIVGAPAGVKGISLFIVPRHRLDADGRPRVANDVRLAGLNHKMGQRGSVNTFLKFGEAGDCHGELVGTPHQGLAYMFHMMNEERIAVGTGAIMQGSVGYQYSLRYARERRQGRHPEQKDPHTPPVAIIEHADVRRMLVQQKCYVEGGQWLCLWAALLVDRVHDPDPAIRRDSAWLLDLLTPIVKGWGSDFGLRANDLAIQVLGGYGYTRDYPVEQCYRDNRINPIHEGTNGIQALDLLGRKALQHDGAALRLLAAGIRATAAELSTRPTLAELCPPVLALLAVLERATRASAARLAAGQVRLALAHAHEYLQALGHLLVAWGWLRMAAVAERALAAGAGREQDFYAGKIAAARYFISTELPIAELLATRVEQGGAGPLAIDPAGL